MTRHIVEVNVELTLEVEAASPREVEKEVEAEVARLLKFARMRGFDLWDWHQTLLDEG